MKNLFQAEAVEEISQRLEKLNSTSQRQWGKMNVAQMLAHCSCSLRTATGETNPPRIFIGRIIGPLAKPMFSNEKPFQKNTPTDKSFIVSDERDFEKEREELKTLINKFHVGGEALCTTHPHSFFGKLTAKEWATGMYKHLDHHFRQFGA